MPADPTAPAAADPSFRQRAAVYLSLTTVSVAQPLLQLYGNNLAVFTTARYSGLVVVAFALGVLLVPPVCLVAIDVVLSAVPRVQIGRAHV